MQAAPGPPPLPPAPPAGFWIRCLAHLIDSALWSALLSCVMIGLFWEEIMQYIQEAARSAANPDEFGSIPTTLPLPMWFSVIFEYVIPIVVLVWLWKWKSATPGKMMLRLKVVDAETRGPLSMKQCILRMLGYIPPLLPFVFAGTIMMSPNKLLSAGLTVATIPLLWGFLSIARHPLKQGWHDRMAGTLVIQMPR